MLPVSVLKGLLAVCYRSNGHPICMYLALSCLCVILYLLYCEICAYSKTFDSVHGLDLQLCHKELWKQSMCENFTYNQRASVDFVRCSNPCEWYHCTFTAVDPWSTEVLPYIYDLKDCSEAVLTFPHAWAWKGSRMICHLAGGFFLICVMFW